VKRTFGIARTRTSVISLYWLTIALLIFASSSFALQVDLSLDDDEPIQEGWIGFGMPATGGDIFEADIDDPDLGSLMMTIEGNTHSRDYNPADGDYEDLSDLLSDGPLMNSPGTTILTIDGLAAGRYEVTTYHHTTQFGPSERAPNPFFVELTDAAVTDEVIAEEVFMSDNGSDELSTLTFEVQSDGSKPVQISFTKEGGDDHFAFPGFSIEPLGAAEDPDIVIALSAAFDDGAFELSITVTNGGEDETLMITSAELSGEQAGAFGGIQFPAELTPGQQGAITLTFDPAGGFGTFAAVLTVASNDPSEPLLDIAITAFQPDNPNLDVATEVAFGTVGANSGATTLTIPVTNTGATEELAVTAAEISGENAAAFAVVAFPEKLAAGAIGEIQVRFTAGGEGEFAAMLTLASTDSSEASLVVALSARVVELEFVGDFMLDFSRDDQGEKEPLQAGWEGFDSPATGGDVEEEQYTNDVLSGPGGSLTITLEGNTHTRDYRPATGDFEELSDLLRDGPLMNAPAEMTVTIAGLISGSYEVTTFHHTTQFGPSERTGTPFSVSLSDANGEDQVVADEVFMSDDGSDALSLLKFEVESNGQDPVEIRFTKEDSNDHFALPAMIISRIGTGALFQITEINRSTESAATIFWTSRPGATYAVEFSPDLQRWLELDDGVDSEGEITSFTDEVNAPNASEGYYRVSVP